MLRTHHCGEVNKKLVNKTITLSAWVNSQRDLGGIIFIDLRDRYGLVQAQFDPNANDNVELYKLLQSIRTEWVLQVTGKVVKRPAKMRNKSLASGEVELIISQVRVLNTSKTLPFELNEDKAQVANEALRLKYRFLDLRRPKLQEMLALKSDFIRYCRQYMDGLGFIEVQTPILANSSPEGARDFLIPSRLKPGSFYALPQAPQQFKQLLMVGGLDKYYQIAPCFRDEDPRHDRHYGEFYQLDMEMSFVEQADIFAVMEPLMRDLTTKFSHKKLYKLNDDKSFRQISWHDAIDKYGTDKPDLRYHLDLVDLSHLFAQATGFRAIDEAIASKGVVKAIKAPSGAKFSRQEIDETIALAQKRGVPGLFYLSLESGEYKSSLVKFLGEEKVAEIGQALEMEEGDLAFLLAGPWRLSSEALGAVRVHLATKLGLRDNNLAAFAWIVDFPMYEYSEIEPDKIDFAHNPFSMPQGGLEALQTKAPLEILAQQFDLVLNGYEVSSGAIRNHSPEIMYSAFALAGYSKAEVDKNFSAMINAFSYGAPPHGGNAPGIDRIVMALNDWDSIRDVYAFPKDNQGQDLMTGAPAPVEQKQLDDLSIKLIKVKD